MECQVATLDCHIWHADSLISVGHRKRACARKNWFKVRFILRLIWISRWRTMTTFWERRWSTPSRCQKYLNQHIIAVTLRKVIQELQVDEFTGKLWEIYETIKSEGGPVQVIHVYHQCDSWIQLNLCRLSKQPKCLRLINRCLKSSWLYCIGECPDHPKRNNFQK